GRRPDRGDDPRGAGGRVSSVDLAWAVGRVTLGTGVRVFAPFRVYGRHRIPAYGGVVLAVNHFSWLDPAAFGIASPRTVYYMAKIEAHGVPGLGQLIRAFGRFSGRRGGSHGDAVR